MNGEAARPGPAGGPQKTEKRKKRKQKRTRKKAPPHESDNLASNSTLQPSTLSSDIPNTHVAQETFRPFPPVKTAVRAGNMSPRKQTLMRHKNSHESSSEPQFVSEAKELRKNRSRGSARDMSADAIDGKYSLMLSNQNMEGKVSLISCPASQIVVYYEQLQDPASQASSGKLLAFGEFEIFQLHNGDVTYLSCGKSFVHPLLPRLKVLRTSPTEFVLPLVNTQRYWKIHIESDDGSKLAQLELVLKSVVRYTNLVSAETASVPMAIADLSDASSSVHAGHVQEHVETPRTPLATKPNHFTPYFNDIPESPPSAPVSPSQVNLYDPAVDSLELFDTVTPSVPWDAPMARQVSVQSLNSAVASFSLDQRPHDLVNIAHDRVVSPARAHSLYNPYFQSNLTEGPKSAKGTRSAGTKKPVGPPSDASSMDSLLDEYEENISMTKSIQYSASRPPSRPPSHAPSLVSAARSTGVNYRRQYAALHYEDNSNSGLQSYRHEERPFRDDFPATSLSRYDKLRQHSVGGRSRKSSVSDLYTSISNWMEPGQTSTNKLSRSISSHSLAAKPANGRHTTLNDTYREIYRSITQQNLSSIINDTRSQQSSGEPAKEKSRTVAAPRQSASVWSNGRVANGNKPHYQNLSKLSSNLAGEKNETPRGAKSDGLSSLEVFRLLSERDSHRNDQPAPSGFKRLFGW